MSEKVQASVIFCEDFREEVGGKPMVLGILPPAGSVDAKNQSDDTLYAFGFIQIPAAISQIRAELKITVSSDVVSETIERGTAQFERDENDDLEEPWTIWVPRKIKVPLDGAYFRVRAELKIGDTRAYSTLKIDLER